MAPSGVRLFWRWKSRRRRRRRIPLYLQDLIADMALRPGSEWPVGRGAAERIGAAVFGGTVGSRDLDRRGTPLDRQGTRPGVRPRDLDWATIGVALRSVRASWLAGPCTRRWAGRHSACIEGCRPHREPASVKSPPRHSGGRSVIGWWCSRGSVSSASPCSRCMPRSPAAWSAISMSKRCDARLASGRWAEPVRRGGTRRCICAARMGDRRRRLVPRSSEVGTTASSLRTLAAQPGGLGRWLLGVTAAGFVAYGFYEIIHARYLHIRRVR